MHMFKYIKWSEEGRAVEKQRPPQQVQEKPDAPHVLNDFPGLGSSGPVRGEGRGCPREAKTDARSLHISSAEPTEARAQNRSG